MSYVTLPDGSEVRIGVKYDEVELERYPGYPCRRVSVKLTFPKNGVEVGYGEAVCSPLDQFNKIDGRRLALMRALHDNRGAGVPLTKADRRAIFNKLFPKFANGGKAQPRG